MDYSISIIFPNKGNYDSIYNYIDPFISRGLIEELSYTHSSILVKMRCRDCDFNRYSRICRAIIHGIGKDIVENYSIDILE